jgi:hypothetical protein
VGKFMVWDGKKFYFLRGLTATHVDLVEKIEFAQENMITLRLETCLSVDGAANFKKITF